MTTVYIIKNKLDAISSQTTKDNLKKAEESLNKGIEQEYKSREYDAYNLYQEYKNEESKSEGIVLFVSYVKEGKSEIDGGVISSEIESIYIGEASLKEKTEVHKQCNIRYLMKKKIDNKAVIINLLDGPNLSIMRDFRECSYVLISHSHMLMKLIQDILIEPKKPELKENYAEVTDTYKLSPYAQHNEQCKRMYGLLEPVSDRTEFQRDRERIVNSRAFRRLVDKAQIFSAEKGDHYRTRMTHTLEVNQIAKAIASSLGLNIDLTEAIALGHDLGHTPFGHQGERTLYKILSSKEWASVFKIDENIYDKDMLGGFKHNYQGVRVLSKLEEKYVDYPGLDISFQVLEGILKHTKLKNADIDVFIDSRFKEELHLDKEFATSLEGQAVAVADEIAQRGHDIDDAVTSGLITIDELMDALSTQNTRNTQNTQKFNELYELLDMERQHILENKRQYVDERELIVGRFISCIVGFFIKDVVKNSKDNIEKYCENMEISVFNKRIVWFSDDKGTKYCDFLEKIVNKRVIADSEVARFDYNANEIICTLFKTYYKNPKLLHKGTLRKIYIDTLQHKNPKVSESAVDLLNGNLDVINYEIKHIINDEITDINDETQKVIFEKRKILIRNIVDYIAGMTDSYAVREYEKIK